MRWENNRLFFDEGEMDWVDLPAKIMRADKMEMYDDVIMVGTEDGIYMLWHIDDPQKTCLRRCFSGGN